MEEEGNHNRSSRPIYIELGIEFLSELLLFLYPFGAEQMNLPHNFWLGLGCWNGGAVIAIRMFWIFPHWVTERTKLERSLIALIFLGLFTVAVYRPVVEAYGRRNTKEASTTSGAQPNTMSAPTPLPSSMRWLRLFGQFLLFLKWKFCFSV
jgi:hypothetical protein